MGFMKFRIIHNNLHTIKIFDLNDTKTSPEAGLDTILIAAYGGFQKRWIRPERLFDNYPDVEIKKQETETPKQIIENKIVSEEKQEIKPIQKKRGRRKNG